MHKHFYASGFLYHPPTRQILLQQQNFPPNTSYLWSLFGGTRLDKEEAEATFQRIIRKLLGVKLNLSAIYPVYSYPSKGIYKNHHIVYAEVKEIQNFSPRRRLVFSWFTFKQILKLPLAEQTKHDITIGQRVIDALARKRLGEKTLG